jgi:hypothetical protein
MEVVLVSYHFRQKQKWVRFTSCAPGNEQAKLLRATVKVNLPPVPKNVSDPFVPFFICDMNAGFLHLKVASF